MSWGAGAQEVNHLLVHLSFSEHRIGHGILSL